MSESLLVNLLEDIVFQPDVPALMKRVRVKPGSANAADLERLIEEARVLARPRGLYLVAFIGERSEDGIVLHGHRFTSHILSVNLANTYRAFPYLATCGMELQAWADSIEDVVWNYWAEAIKEQALYSALKAIFKHMEDHQMPGETASMSPGSLVDWPIQQQRVLFDLFGAHAGSIGVSLNDSMLMVPTKSVSGIRFPNQDHFENCQLCPREGCPGRRAVYDPELYDQKFCLHQG